MDNPEQNTNSPITNTPTPAEPTKSSIGPAVGLIIILFLIIAGSFYFFDSGQPSTEPVGPSVADIESDLTRLEEQSESDEVRALEKDLQETDLENLDQEIEQIEEEISELEKTGL